MIVRCRHVIEDGVGSINERLREVGNLTVNEELAFWNLAVIFTFHQDSYWYFTS